MIIEAYLKGLALMSGLIVAIGAQNAFVLKQGLIGRGIFLAASICLLCDASLVTLGATGLGTLFAENNPLRLIVSLIGSLFLLYYGVRSLRAAKKATGLNVAGTDGVSMKKVAATAFAVSLLNPHVYIDTVMLVGGYAAHFEGPARIACACGAITVSATWFFGLGFGAQRIAPVLRRPKVWRVLDLLIGVMMVLLGAGLMRDSFYLAQPMIG